MDENTKIFRNLTWLRPIRPPIIIEVIMIVAINIIGFRFLIKIIIGAIFCQVRRVKVFIHLSPSMISGNQK